MSNPPRYNNRMVDPARSAVLDDEFARSLDQRDIAAKSVDYQKLEKALDMTHYMRQVESLLAQPIKIPGSQLYHTPAIFHRGRQSIFSVSGIWPTDNHRKENVAKLFNFENVKGRDWLKEHLLEESDSEEELERGYAQKDIRAILKVHKMQRKLQRRCSKEKNVSQYSYYGAGFLSAQDSYPEPPGLRSKATPATIPTPKSSDLPTASVPGGVPSSALLQPLPEPDDIPAPLSIDAHCGASTIIPLPPLSH